VVCLISVMCLQRRQTSTAADVAASDAPTQSEDSLTAEQRAVMFGSTEAVGREVTPKSKRRAVSLKGSPAFANFTISVA